MQEEVFADGVVTFAEYERAVLAAIQCIRDEGFPVEGPFRYPEGETLVLYPGADPTLILTYHAINVEDSDRFGEVDGRCQAQWSERIAQVWLRKHAPTEQEVQAWLERAWACAREKGAPLSEPPTENEALLSVTYGCRPWEPSG